MPKQSRNIDSFARALSEAFGGADVSVFYFETEPVPEQDPDAIGVRPAPQPPVRVDSAEGQSTVKVDPDTGLAKGCTAKQAGEKVDRAIAARRVLDAIFNARKAGFPYILLMDDEMLVALSHLGQILEYSAEGDPSLWGVRLLRAAEHTSAPTTPRFL